MNCECLPPLCAGEGGQIVPQVSFTDRNGKAVTPDSARYSLVTADGETINEKANIDITPLEPISEILLQGDDLPWSGTLPTDLYAIYLYVESDYTEEDLGPATQNQEIMILVEKRRGIGATVD